MRGGERGFTLIETMIALGLLLIVAAGVLPLGLIAVNTTENQGHLNARVTEYAQDKLEQLMSLSYGNIVADTRVFPANNTGGSGLAFGGSVNPAAPVDLYVDYLDADGTLIASVGGAPPAGWFYQRLWAITVPPSGTANLKLITVMVIVRSAAAGGAGQLPQATVAALKTAPF